MALLLLELVAIPVTIIGDDVPVAVIPSYDLFKKSSYIVTSYDVAGGDPSGNSKETDTAPSLYGRPVPMSVTTILIGANGSRKSFC